MKKISSASIVLVYFITLACASSTKDVDMVNKAGAYFESFKELPYMELQLGHSYKNEISVGSDVFNFEDGKSFFLAYQLPMNRTQYHVMVSSYMMGEHINKASIFYPTVLLLDENYNVVRSLSNKNFEFKKIFLKETWGLPYKYEAIIDFKMKSEWERYMIIYSSNDQRNQHTSVKTMRVVPLVLPGVAGAIPVGKDEKLVRHSPVGRVRVDVIQD